MCCISAVKACFPHVSAASLGKSKEVPELGGGSVAEGVGSGTAAACEEEAPHYAALTIAQESFERLELVAAEDVGVDHLAKLSWGVEERWRCRAC